MRELVNLVNFVAGGGGGGAIGDISVEGRGSEGAARLERGGEDSPRRRTLRRPPLPRTPLRHVWDRSQQGGAPENGAQRPQIPSSSLQGLVGEVQ